MISKLIKLIKAIKEENTDELNRLISDPEILDKLLTYTAKLANMKNNEYDNFIRLLEEQNNLINKNQCYMNIESEGVEFKYFNRNDPTSLEKILLEVDNEPDSNTNLMNLQKGLEKFFNNMQGDKNTKWN